MTRGLIVSFIAIALIVLPCHAEEPLVRLQAEFAPGFIPHGSGAEAGLWMVVDEAEGVIKSSPSIIDDSHLNAYIHDIVCRLARDYCDDIRIYIIRTPYFNASMMPNGVMQVWSGLLLRTSNEAQLSAVLGHEIGHFLRRHTVKQFESAKVKTSALAFFTVGVAGAVAYGNMSPTAGRNIIDISQFGVLASIFAYGRDSEREADRYGVQLVHDAGLDASESMRVWQNLLDEDAVEKHRATVSPFFRTHPDPGERIVNLGNYSRALGTGASGAEALRVEAYQEVVGPQLKTWIEDEISLHQLDKSEVLFTRLLKEGAYPGLFHYALGEVYRTRAGDGDVQRALDEYEMATRESKYPAEVHRALGLLYYKGHKLNDATRNFEEYLRREPDAHDREMIDFYISSGRAQ